MFNDFNLKDRPFINIGDFIGQDGNSFILANNYNKGMRKAGFIEESKYLGGGESSNYLNPKLVSFGFDREFIEKLVFSLAETNYEIEEKNKENDEDIVIVIKNNKKKSEDNYLGRGSHFYTDVSNIKEEVLKHFSHFLDKDKVGMTVLDHYLLSDKYTEYVVALQYILINMNPEEYKEALNNKVFGLSVIEEASKNSITLLTYTNLAKYILNQDEELIKDITRNIDKKLNINKKNNLFIKSIIDENLNLLSDLNYFKDQIPEVELFRNEILKNITNEDYNLKKIIEKNQTPEILAKIEKNILFTEIKEEKNLLENRNFSKKRI